MHNPIITFSVLSQFVRTVGSPDFQQTLEPFARFKIGFTF